MKEKDSKENWEIEDLNKAYKLIELGYPETDVYKLAKKLYDKRMKDIGV